jgi:hypothetical protein
VPVPADDPQRLLVLLLPAPLEAFERRELAEELLRAPGVVAVDPPRTSYRRLAGLPDAIGVTLASKQARRLRRRLPGTPAAVAIFDPAQYPLARGLLVQLDEAELWYGPTEPPGQHPRMQDLHLMARKRAALVFDPHLEEHMVWERLADLELPG